ncbi:transposase [Mesorhizobium sp. 1B3]|uniref:transposase n=1 Tax=Mesorhizobium sp. 1B3 TaxID=3243599 RepID=UPI003D9726AD
MRRQARPFVVEVKQKRGNLKRGRSIWGDLDLSAVAAEVEELDLSKPQLIDSNGIPVDAEDAHISQTEHLMADPKEAELLQAPTESTVTVEAPETKKKASRPKRAKPQPKRPPAKEAGNPKVSEAISRTPARTARKIYSDQERVQKLGQIEQSIGRGDSIKTATKQAGISEQTYYQWKKAAASTSKSGDLKDLLALEEENARLKSLLAERLRKENAELKKKLGLG